jgi:hypothetical protein
MDIAETIYCPYSKGENTLRHRLEPKSQQMGNFLIHYCGKCQYVISIEDSRYLNILSEIAIKLRLDE